MNRREEFNDLYHVVCLVDFLGQKERLAEWAKADPNNTKVYFQAIKKAAGTVIAFQEIVDNFLAEFEKPSTFDSKIKALSPEKQEVFARYKNCRLGTQQFADTFVFYVPTVNSTGDVSAEGIYRILTASSMMMLTSLAGKVPLRGSICVGRGVELDDHNFYGPALAEAHYIEDKVAQWPRVIVSNSANGFIQALRKQNGSDDLSKIMRLIGDLCPAMICKNREGQLMVDFLGEGFHRIFKESSKELAAAVQKAYEFRHF